MSLKQPSNGETSTAVAAKGLSLYRAASFEEATSTPAEQDYRSPTTELLQKITSFAKQAQASFLEHLRSSEYCGAHSWLLQSCMDLHNELASLQRHSNATELAQLKQAQQQLYQISRAGGPPPLPSDVAHSGGKFVPRRVPADNSCLFHCFKGIYKTQDTLLELRLQCIDYVNTNKQELSMVAGTEFVSDYDTSMSLDTTWGGAFEINVQCQLRRVRITLFDLINKSEQTFQCDQQQPLTAAFLVRVDGNHFDYMGWTESNAMINQTVFSIYDETALRRARRCARHLGNRTVDGEWRRDGEIIAAPLLRQTSWDE